MPHAAAGRAVGASAGVERGPQRAASDPPRRHQGDGDGASNCGDSCDSEDTLVDGDVARPRDPGRVQRGEQPHDDGGDRDAASSADSGQQQRFHEQQAEKAGARCAERRADRELLRARVRVRQQQVCHVRARDQQDRADGENQDKECRADPAEYLDRYRQQRHAEVMLVTTTATGG